MNSTMTDEEARVQAIEVAKEALAYVSEADTLPAAQATARGALYAMGKTLGCPEAVLAGTCECVQGECTCPSGSTEGEIAAIQALPADALVPSGFCAHCRLPIGKSDCYAIPGIMCQIHKRCYEAFRTARQSVPVREGL